VCVCVCVCVYVGGGIVHSQRNITQAVLVRLSINGGCSFYLNAINISRKNSWIYFTALSYMILPTSVSFLWVYASPTRFSHYQSRLPNWMELDGFDAAISARRKSQFNSWFVLGSRPEQSSWVVWVACEPSVAWGRSCHSYYLHRTSCLIMVIREERQRHGKLFVFFVIPVPKAWGTLVSDWVQSTLHNMDSISHVFDTDREQCDDRWKLNGKSVNGPQRQQTLS
jgi:hypothetical protein